MTDEGALEMCQGKPVVYKKNKNTGKQEKFVLVECQDCFKQRLQRLDKFMYRKTDLCVKCNGTRLFKKGTTHSLSHTRIYQKYMNMLNRCYKVECKSFKNYGGRGIGIALEWLGENGFINFYNWAIQNGWDESSKLQIDRIDNDGDYCPENCAFISQLENLKKVDNLFGIKGLKVKKEAPTKTGYADIAEKLAEQTDEKGQVLVPLWDWLDSLGKKYKTI